MNEFSSKWNIQENSFDKKVTFRDLKQNNITSEQLYYWSAPFDIMEKYQFYLDGTSQTEHEKEIMSKQIFYNCTLPRFGLSCEYSLDMPIDRYATIYEIIDDFYNQNYAMASMTCYTHLKCNRGPIVTCLDWSEICDGNMDCLNGGIDEENCWQIEMNQCGDDEYQCDTGQCISSVFSLDSQNQFECIDQSDEDIHIILLNSKLPRMPMFHNEEITCRDNVDTRTLFTSSCFSEREYLIEKNLLSRKPNSLTDACWLSLQCYFEIYDMFDYSTCDKFSFDTLAKQINESCPDIFFFPESPIFFGHIYFIYVKRDIIESNHTKVSSSYICYNDRLCNGFYSNRTIFIFNNMTCRRPEDFPVYFDEFNGSNWLKKSIDAIYQQLYACKTVLSTSPLGCNDPMMYQCRNSSKCISKYRIGNNLKDCDYGDDEDQKVINDICTKEKIRTLFKCPVSKKCIYYRMVEDGKCDCKCIGDSFCEDEHHDAHLEVNDIDFNQICDGLQDLIPLMINGKNHTDETECERWDCHNKYTKCDSILHCLNGEDELNCHSSSIICPENHHVCISIDSRQPMCLPIEKMNDGKIDCLHSVDETKSCELSNINSDENQSFCQNNTSLSILDCYEHCHHSHCYTNNMSNKCYLYFKSAKYTNICTRQTKLETNDFNQLFSFEIEDYESEYKGYCHRGIPLHVWTNRAKHETNVTCLCPTNYYGDQCQYQNERVSVTLKFHAYTSSQRTLFSIIISLVDDSKERIVHSHQQLSFLYIRDCSKKFNFYLTYATRPKLADRNYFVQIDIYETMSFNYRGGFRLPINYRFLPVHRIAYHLNIPHRNQENFKCSTEECLHGRCISYSEDPQGEKSCLCNEGWSGQYCNVPHQCSCSYDSLCIGKSADNRSICVCPWDRIGSRCLIHQTICTSNTCLNNGRCIPNSSHKMLGNDYICLCPYGFMGKRCEEYATEIKLSFTQDIRLSQSMIIHFMSKIANRITNGSTFKMIPRYRDTVSIYWHEPFHMAFVQIFDTNLYLVAKNVSYARPLYIEKKLYSMDRCKHVSEIMNDTIGNLPIIRRIKYYHVLCQETSLLQCFYDEIHLCLCEQFDRKPQADCIKFNVKQKYNCFGQNNCENEAQCLQNKEKCPTTSICACKKCTFGSLCQFSSNGFGLSLDSILGYYIAPHTSINQQPTIIKMTIAVTTIMSIAGLISGIFSWITFANKSIPNAGCDLYLIGSSITTLTTMFMLALKSFVLIHLQISYTTNKTFLNLQCISIDFLTQVSLSLNQWLNCCIAFERAMTAVQGVNFNKNKSKRMAKYLILCLILLTIITTIQDPINRRLIYDDNDNEDKRIWCAIIYRKSIKLYNSIMNIFHFVGPFTINLISTLIIIKRTTRSRNTVHPKQTFQQTIHIQFQRCKHILITPIILVTLAIPRLLFSVFSGCMNSSDEAKVFLFGYFISFISPMLTFVTFVLPSKFYKNEFRKTVQRYFKAMKLFFRN